ncbi:LOW QUALITY PROTEIN: tight junction protein ZO-1 [Bacillus rossius redtenbacheri]|uniref:LOW QUALITY PROTEIN: tight junction protein ZO-1 n=1 Tax=Bacillus rossius redtenbacheri TaxID=93214 RepID=UPI002FDCAE61
MDREPRMVEGAPPEQQGGERVVWEYHHVTLTRVPGYGFGIAVSGGRDNPHFTNGDPSIAISDVLKAGPAEGKLQVNDRIISANGASLENAEYATAVQVLRDSGNTVALVVRRRVVLPACPEPQTLKLSLAKSKKKDDFGLVLGCKIYVREVAGKALQDCKDPAAALQEGDVLLKINNHATDGMTLKEAKKLIDSSKERLNLVVRREHRPAAAASQEQTALPKTDSHGNYLDGLGAPNYSSQNLYVQPPTRHQHSLDDKSNLLPRGRSRGPLLDVSLSQLDRPSTPAGHGAHLHPHHPHPHHHAHHGRSRSGLEEGGVPDGLGPPRPPPPRPEDYFNSRRQLYEDDPLVQRAKQPMPDPRFITFQKEGSVGIRLTGGNEVGIFVTAVQPGSPASVQGLQPGDKILKVNDMDMKGVTREEAVLFLLSLNDQIDLIVQHRKDEYEQIVASQRGDSFHIKAHFNYDQPNKGEMSFRKGDVFHVVDTLHNGVVGSWQVFRIGRNNQEVQKGIIPNKSRAEELATAQFNATKKEMSASESRGSFFRRRRGSHRRSKSLSRDHWDDVVFSDSISKFPAYERVVLKHPGFVRPVVLFGPVADIARERLLKDFPDKFTSPQLDSNLVDVPKSQKSSGIIRLSAIREIMDRGKHALLDITPNAVDRLNYAQFYPIVIFLRAESKHVIKELRAGLSKAAHKSSKKLLEQCGKLEKVWSHTFSCSVTLTSPDAWYRKVRELIDKHQGGPLWMSESKRVDFFSDMYLLPLNLGPSPGHLPHPRYHTLPLPASRYEVLVEPRHLNNNYPYLPVITEQNFAFFHAVCVCLSLSLSRPPAPPQPDESLSDDFLFPMTSRLSYASSPESDLDLSPEPRAPAPPPAGGAGRLVKSSSDPSIATQEDAGPGYHAPPPYSSASHPYKQSYEPHNGLSLPSERQHQHQHSHGYGYGYGYGHGPGKRHSQGGDGKYGFSPPASSSSALDLDYPSPPHYPSSPPRLANGGGGGGAAPRSPLAHSPPPPELPPRVDRASKPSRGPSGQSAAERLLGKGEGGTGRPDGCLDPPNYINAGLHHRGPGGSSLERHNMKASSYDSVSSYDSYNNRLGPNAHDDLKCNSNGNGGAPTSPRNHDPYRFTRSTAQPIKAGSSLNLESSSSGGGSSGKPSKPPDYNKFRPGDYKPPPPPKTAAYKPVPPPKPKNYRPPQPEGVGGAPGHQPPWGRGEPAGYDQACQHAKSYSAAGGLDAGNFPPAHQNGGDDVNGGFDSGHGSSLDRNYNPSLHRGGQCHYGGGGGGAPGAARDCREAAGGLDLANREQRGSAFELYKKPSAGGGRSQAMQHYLEASLRGGEGGGAVVATARGVFTHEGGTLSSPDTGVAIVIPPGALPPGTSQEIYFKVCHGNKMLPPFDDDDKGETLMSPLVMCGPHGLKFSVPIELRLPHWASSDPTDSRGFSIKPGEAADRSMLENHPDWHCIPLENNNAFTENSVSVLIDHF